MEKFKINSQELIEEQEGNEEIFEAFHSPDSHIFSLQRFADEKEVTLTGGRKTAQGDSTDTVTKLTSASSKFSEFISTDTTKYGIGTAGTSMQFTTDGAFNIYSNSYTINTLGTSDVAVAAGFTEDLARTLSDNVKFYSVSISDDEASIIQATGSTNAHLKKTDDNYSLAEANSGSDYGRYVGFTANNVDEANKVDIYWTTRATDTTNFSNGQETNGLNGLVSKYQTDSYVWKAENVEYSEANSDSVVQMVYDYFQSQGGQNWVKIVWKKDSETLQTDYYAVNFNDVKVTDALPIETDVGFINSAYVLNVNDSDTNIAFTSAANIKIDKGGIGKHVINDWEIEFAGLATAEDDKTTGITLTAGQNKEGQVADDFSALEFGKDETGTVEFTFNKDAVLNLDTYVGDTDEEGATYTFKGTDDTDKGSVTFAKDSVTIGDSGKKGFEVTNAATQTLYNLDGIGSFTFTTGATNFVLDADGEGKTLFSAMSFTTSGAATIIADGTSNLTLSGAFDNITSTNLTGISFVLSDTGATDATSAVFGGLKFSDVKGDGSNTVITFTNLTDVKISGVFSVESKTNTVDITNAQFTLLNDATATLGTKFIFSDTSATTDAIVKFGAAATDITLSGVLNVGTQTDKTFTSVGFTFSDTNTIAGLNGLLFTNTATSGSSYVEFGTKESAITLAGTFNVASDTKALTNLGFNLSDAAIVNFTGFGAFSDTAGNNNTSYVEFKSATEVTLAGVLSGTSVGNAAYTLKTTATTFTLDGTSFSATADGTDSNNTLSAVSMKLTLDATHSDTFAPVGFDATKEVSGFNMGKNISVANGGFTVENAEQILLKGLYFNNQGNGAATVSFDSTGTVITNATKDFQISAVGTGDQSNTLVGLAGTSFTATAGSFFLADGSGTKINSLAFVDTGDNYVTKLVLDGGAASTMGIFGDVTLTGSDSKMTYVLNGFAGSDSKLTFSGIEFAGSQTGVLNTAANEYTLTNSGTSAFSIDGTFGAVSSFTMLATTANGSFLFGNDSNTGITFVGSGSAINNATAVFGAGAFNASNTVTVGGGLLKIDDATGSDGYTVMLNNAGKVVSISDIDNGAVLTNVASATQVWVDTFNGSGTYTFNTSYLTGGDTNKQTFVINGDANGVVFELNNSGTVLSIAGIDNGATVLITDTLLSAAGGAKSKTTWTREYKELGTWTSKAEGSWNADKYLGYVVGNDAENKFKVKGITTDGGLAHEDTTDNYSTMGKSDTGVFTVLNGAFDGTSTSIFFQNNGTTAYSANYSDTTEVVSVFKNLGTTGAHVGIKFGTDTGLNGGQLVYTDRGTATKLTSLAAFSDTTNFSLTLGKWGIGIYESGTDVFKVSGQGVGLSINSSIVTVGATTGSDATVFMLDGSKLAFSETSVGNYTINSNTFRVDVTAGVASATKSADGFVFGLDNGAAITDTYVAGNGISSGLTINNVNLGMYSDSTTFAFGAAGSGSASDSLTVSLGTLGVIGTSQTLKEFAGDTNLNLAAPTAQDSATLIIGTNSYTGVSAATFTLGFASNTQLANVTSGIINEQVASGTSFFFNDALYTATSSIVSFKLDSTTDSLLANSTAIGVTAGTSEYVVALSDTYTMYEGGSVALSYSDGALYNAVIDFTKGSGTLKLNAGDKFRIADALLSGTGVALTANDIFTYTASGTGTLSLTVDGASETVALGGVIGTRLDSSDSFLFNGLTYSTLSDSLTYKIDSSIASSTGAMGVVFNGIGQRDYVKAQDSGLTLTALTYASDTYKFSGGLLKVDIASGESVFSAGASGSAEYVAAAGTDIFHFKASGTNVFQTYTATGTAGATLFGVISDGAITSLYNAEGFGFRTGSGTYTIGALNSDTYKMDDKSIITLTLSGTGVANSAFGTEAFTSGTGVLSVSGTQTFSLSDYYLGVASATATSPVYKYTTSGTTVLNLALDQGSETIVIKSGVGTRLDSSDSFLFNGLTYSTLSDSLTYKIDSSIASSTGAMGVVFNGIGQRDYVKAQDSGLTLTALTYASDTYTFSGGLLKVDIASGEGVFSAGASGSAEYVAAAGTDIFHFKASGTDVFQTYTATGTAGATLFGVISDGAITSLYNAEGFGFRIGSGTYKVDALSDTYQMKDATITLTLSGTGVANSAFGTEAFTKGTGTFVVDAGSSFSIANAFLNGTANSGTTFGANDIFTYTASNTGALTLTLDGTNTKIALGSVIGTRTTDTGTVFTYDPDGDGPLDTYSYTATTDLTYKIAAGDSATGVLYSGVATRVLGANDATSTAMQLIFQSNTFMAAAGSIMTLNIVDGKASETFTSGSATWQAKAVGETFYFDYNGDSSIQTNEAYKAVSTETALFGVVNGGSVTSLYNAFGAGTREGSGTYTIGALNSDTYKMDDKSVITLTLSGTGVAGTVFGTEAFTSGTGVLSVSGTQTFSLSDYYLGVASATAESQVFQYTTSGTTKLQLTLDQVSGTTVETIAITEGFATRTDTMTEGAAFDFNGQSYSATTTDFTFFVSAASQTSAYGNVFNGAGQRAFNAASDSSLVSQMVYNSDTYTFSAGLLNIDIASNTGSFSAGAGSATWQANAAGDAFHFNNEEYKATSSGTALFGIVDTGSVTGLYNAIGFGTRDIQGTETYVAAELGDSYTMVEGSTKTLEFEGTEETPSTEATEYFTSGNGSYTAVSETGTFSLSDRWLDASATGTETFTYTATDSDVALNISLTGKDSGTITIESGMGIRLAEGEEAETFTFDPGLGETQEYVAEAGSVYYSIEKGATKAKGDFFAGTGTREFTSGSTKAELVGYLGDTYTALAGTAAIDVVNKTEYTETFVSGSATWTANAEGDEFHFVYEGATNTYSAAAGTVLYGTVDRGSVTGLYNATGAGNRTTTDTEVYTIDDLNGESYELEAGATVTLSFSDTGDAFSATEDYTSGNATKTIESATGTFTLSEKWFNGSGSSETFTFTATDESDVELAFTLYGKDSGTIRVTSGHGTREVNEGDTFKFSPVEGATYTYNVTEQARYGIDSTTTVAGGNFYGGAGERTMVAGESTSAVLSPYFSDTYTPVAGTVGIRVENDNWTETFVSGSATWQANAENNGVFHFDYNGDGTIQDNEVYTAAEGAAALYGIVESDSVTGLYNATGTGNRTTLGTETYVVADLGDSYTMAEGATVALTLSGTGVAGSAFGLEDFASGTGTFEAEAGSGTFTVNDYWLNGGTSTETFTYTATEDANVELSLSLTGKDSGTITIDSGIGTREAEAGTFEFDAGAGSHTYTADSNRVFSITTGATSAEGSFYAGTGTRGIEDGENFSTTYLSDTYSVTSGIISVAVTAGEGSETFVGGSGTYTANTDDIFHFAGANGTYEYTATTETTLGISFEGTNTTLTEASGAGARDMDSSNTFTISALNNDEYVFDAGQVQISIESVDSYSETVYAGTGYMNVSGTGTFTAAFDASGTITENAYLYTASEATVLYATLESGSAISQSFESGVATRAGIDGSDTTFTGENGQEYEIQDVANTTFVLNKENASNGAQGSLYDGFGVRAVDDGYTYISEEGNSYSDFTESSTLMNGYTAGVFGSDTLYNANATQAYAAGSETFTFKGTEYTAGASGATMALTAVEGEVTELLSEGSGIFNGDASDTTFTYDENLYHVSGTATLELFAGSETPEFVSGTGVKDMVASDTFKYTPDGNTYTLTSDEGRLIAVGNGTNADVYFTSGTAVNNLTEGQTFNYTFEGASHTYTAAAEGATLGLTGVAASETAQAEFVGGAGSRTQSDAEGVEFAFEGNTYTSTADEIGLTLELNDSGTAYEYATSGQGSREITEGEFVYESPIDNQTHTYQATSVVLELELVDGQGTETFVSGEATRAMNVGDTFELAPDKFEFDGSETMTFTATEAGEYLLTAKNEGDGTSDLLFMGYNVDAVNETMLNGVATGTAVSPFKYESKVTSEKETYEGDGVVFGVTVEGGANTATWISGTATMTLDADRTFAYTPDEGSEHTYTATGEGATFTRTGEDDEVFTSGEAYRLSEESDTYTVTDTVNNEYTVDAGARIALIASDSIVSEVLGAGSATFTAEAGNTFNYEVNGTSHTYTADADVALQGSVVNGEFGELIAADGVGTREFGEDEATTTTILGDNYSVESGKFALVLTTENIGNETEVFAEGSGTFSTTGVFHVNDYFLGTGTDTEIYEYSAIGDSGVTMSLTVENGSSTIVLESGMGTREVDTESFTFNDKEYTNAENVAYAISSTSVAEGYLYSAVGTRTTEDSSGTVVFNEDTYNVDEGATMVLTVEEGEANEVMSSGSATYVAEVGDVFHFESSTGIQAYTAISNTTLQLAFEGDSSTQTLSAIDGAGTRAAIEADETLTLEYQDDVYTAMAGSSTILFTATGDVDSANEVLVEDAGTVINRVAASDTFHTNAAGDWYEYTANDDVNITLSLSDSVQSFDDVSAIRTASDTTFVYNDNEYTASGNEVYSLTGSGTADDLTESIFEAEGYRTSSESETFVSNWNNTYDISSGTYAISITDGDGDETLTGGAGVAEFATGDSFNYGDSATSFVANIEGATLTLSMDGEGEVESLTAGAGFDGSNTYIAVSEAKVSIEASSNANLSAIAADDGIVTLTADAENGLSNVENAYGPIEAEFEANGTLKVNGRDFTAVNGAAEMAFGMALEEFEAGEGTIAAEGDFTTADAPTLANKAIGVASDTDIVVTFDSDAITKLEKLSDGVVISDAAGATKAITDSTGTFEFSANEQSFNISNDEEVTFKLDENGLVTGIAGIASGSSFEITDGSWTGTINISSVGQVLQRNDDGTWTDTAVTAESYIVSLGSGANDSLMVYAVDSEGDLNEIDNNTFGSVNGTNVNITVEGAVTDKEVYVVNKSEDKVINFSGAANLNGVGITSDTAAVQLTTDTATFVAGKLADTDFTANTTLGVANGQFSIGASGEMAVEATSGTANVSMSDNDSVGLVAGTVASSFAVNDGSAVTLAIGSADADGKGIFTAQLTDSVLSGLTPHDVETGTAVVSTDAEGTTFAIGDSAIVVAGDTDGMTLEIENDQLVGLSDISTDATVDASAFAGTELAINGDTDNKVTASTDPIKYNTTKEQWLAGDATSIEGATGYLVSVTADNLVELYYTTSDSTDTKLTTNKADYEAVFSGLAPESDGVQPPYENGVAINSSLDSGVKVSIAAGSTGINATMADESGSKDLILITAGGNYNINDQEIIPSAEVTVNAMGTGVVSATINAATTIDSGSMSFTAETDTEIAFSNDAIVLGNTTKVTNTDSEKEFKVKGTVTFDSIAVVASTLAGVQAITVKEVTANVAPAALTINDKDINVTGGDLAFTIDATEAVPEISGISGDATVTGALVEAAKVITESAGTFKIGDSDPFTISDDNEVAFTVKDNVVTAIDSLEGTATGNFSNQVNIDSDHSVLILNDTLVGVTADGTQVTAIDGVGSADSDVVIANAGGATIVTTNLNGSIYFGGANSTVNSQHYNVTDADSTVSFLTSSLTDYTPSVSGVQGLNEGTIAISQDESGFGINDAVVTLSSVSSDVTIAVANDTITSVLGLEGGVNGLAADVVVNAIDSDVTINGAALQVAESGNTNLTVYAAEGGFDTVTGLNNGAVVTTAKDAHVVTEEEGVFTFVDDNFTISGDSSVTFETDGNSRVKNIADFAGTLTSSEYQVTVNGDAVGVSNTDASIVSAGSGVSSVLGLADGDSATVPVGTAVEMPGTTESDSDTALTVNGKNYVLEADTDGVVVSAGGANGVDSITGLSSNASLAVGTAGVYNVNGELLNANAGDVIIGDEEGSAHVYDANDIDLDENSSVEDILNKLVGSGQAEDRYVEKLDSEQSAKLAAQMAAGDYREANGNIEMAAANTGDSVQSMNFANTSGVKKVSLEGGAQDVTFNNAGQNIAIIPKTSGNNDTAEKNITFGNGGDIGIIEEVGTPINITFGKGADMLTTKGSNVRGNLNNAGRVTIMPIKGKLKLEGYDANKGQSIQSTLTNIFQAIKKNIIKLTNDIVTLNNGAIVDFSGGASSSDAASDAGARVVNFKNVKGLVTKVLYTYDEGDKDIDMSTDHEDMVIKANFTEGNAQRKSGTEIIRTGSGNDTGLGGSGDVFNLGSGYNQIIIDENRNLSEAGTIVEQTANTGSTDVDGFHTGYGDNADVVRIDTSQANVSYDGNTLKYSFGAANLNLKAVTNSSSDLANSADISEDSRIGEVNSMKTLVQDVNDTSGTNIRMEVAAKDSVINVERTDDVIAQSYVGENSGLNLGKFDEAAMINLNTGEGNLGGEFVKFRGITKLQGSSASNTLIGSGADNNLIAAGVGVSSIWGGGASNDTLSGIGGTSLESLKTASTSFFFMNGDGKDLINGFEFLTSDNNDIADKLNVHTAAITDVQTSGNDVIISLTNEADKLTIKEAVGKDFRVEYGEFGNANTLTAQVQDSVLDFNGRANYYQATGKNASVVANSDLTSADIWLNNDRNHSSNTFVGDIKYVNASNVEGKTTIVGNANDNILVAGQEGSSLWGGDLTGNDTLVGGNGSDMFWYGKEESNGHDIVTNIDGSDIVNLFDANLEDILSADVTSNTAVITMKDSRNTLTVQGNVTSGISFRLKDGTTYSIDSNRNWVQK